MPMVVPAIVLDISAFVVLALPAFVYISTSFRLTMTLTLLNRQEDLYDKMYG